MDGQGPIATLPEVCEDPQLRANNAFQEVHHPVAGTFETVGQQDETDLLFTIDCRFSSGTGPDQEPRTEKRRSFGTGAPFNIHGAVSVSKAPILFACAYALPLDGGSATMHLRAQ